MKPTVTAASRSRLVAAALAAALATLSLAPVIAQEVVLTESTWNVAQTGNQLWTNAANWTPSVPNSGTQIANIGVALGANLNLDIGAGVTVAGLKLGATAAARTTTITGTGPLTFRNEFVPPALTEDADFNNDTYVDGHDFLIWQRHLAETGQTTKNNGDANFSGTIGGDDLSVWKNQFGRGAETTPPGAGFIHSFGVAGSVHTINTGVHLDNEQLAIAGSTNVTINGALTYAGDPNAANASSAAIRVLDPNLVVTINGNVAFTNNDALETVDFRVNDSERAQGRLVLNGIVSGEGDIAFGTASNNARLPLSTVELNGNNTYNGSVRASRGNLVLGHDNALGFNSSAAVGSQYATYRQEGPANQFGYNIVSTSDDRVINNPMTLAQWQSFRGARSLEWAGEITQTNNRGMVNLLPAGKTLELSGRINIFEDEETAPIQRRFEVHGTGTTIITGSVRDTVEGSDDTPTDYQLVKRGMGVLRVQVAAGNNNHVGDDVIYMGNWHYANNDALNAGIGMITAHGGAIGVDTGVANNSAFMDEIRPTSTGGLQLAASDAAANLDFTTTLANAANMTVAAPETGLTFTGSIVPAGNRYQLGGGTGTLTLPNAQLAGDNRLEVRNGGTVQLLGDNAYTGSTTILTKYTSTNDAMAAVDSSSANLSVGSLYYKEVAPTLVVDKLANGGVASSVGSSTNAAANLFIQGGTLKYVGAGDATDRLFTVGTGGATIDASGTGALVLNNTGALGRDDAEDRVGSLDDFSRNPNVLYDFPDTSDIVIGMTVNDPDVATAGNFLGANAAQPNRLQFSANAAGVPSVLVTGLDDNGRDLGINVNLPFIYKKSRIVFGAVPRTLTLSGANAGDNTIAAAISNSAAGSVVNITKTGSGKWILTGANTFTGTTTVSAGTLLVNGSNSGNGAVTVATGATLGGTGSITGAVTVNGALAPGNAGPGALSVTGPVTFNGGSTAAFEIGGTAAGQFDELNLSGALSASGTTLSVALINGFVPSVGNSFDLLDFGSITGSFSLSLPNLGAGKSWNTSALLTTGTISVAAGIAAVPEPASAALALGALALLRMRRRPS